MAQGAARRAGRALLITLAIFAGISVVVWVIRPPCLILHFTGLYCPGCGAQRMIWSLFRGDPAQAFRHNPFLFVLAPLLSLYLIAEVTLYIMGRRQLYTSRWAKLALAVAAVAAVTFMVLRNQPQFAFLAP